MPQIEYLERSKSRSFLALLGAANLTPVVPLTSKLESILMEEDIHLLKLRELQFKSLNRSNYSPSDIMPGFVSNELDRFYTKIKQFDARYVSYRKGEPLKTNEIRRLLIHISD